MVGPLESSGRIGLQPTACSQVEPAAQSRPSGLRPLARPVWHFCINYQGATFNASSRGPRPLSTYRGARRLAAKERRKLSKAEGR